MLTIGKWLLIDFMEVDLKIGSIDKKRKEI